MNPTPTHKNLDRITPVFYAVFAGFFLGVVLRSFFDLGIYFSIFVLVLAAAFLVYATFSGRGGKHFTFLLSISLFSLILGIARYDIADNHEDKLQKLIGRPYVYQGIVSDEPDYRERSILLKVDLEKANRETADEKILVRIANGAVFKYGDEVLLIGEVKKPENFETETGRIFDYEKYLEKEGIYYLMENPKINILAHDKGEWLTNKLFFIKNSFMDSIKREIPHPESALLGGLLLGAKQSLPKDVTDYLRKAGVIHVIVLSGYNITIVARFIMFLFGFLALRFRLFLGALSIILFSLMVGGGATVVRAAVMALIALLATFMRRDYSITRALLLAGFLMVFLNPKILIFDLSFELSFLATVGLIYVSPIIEKYFSFVPERFGIREIVVATIATQIFVLPFLVYSMGNFSTVSLLVNLLILPLIPLTMLLGFITGLVGLISTSLSIIPSIISYYLLHYELSVAQYFGNLPFASYIVPQFPSFILVLIYAMLISLIFILRERWN